MPSINLGQNYTVYGALYSNLELAVQLSNLGLSSNLLESTYLNSAAAINSKSNTITLPDNLAEDLYTIYRYNLQTLTWQRLTGYKLSGNKLILDNIYSGLLVAFPFDAFRVSLYDDGAYVYTLYLNRLDNRVYRHLSISSASYKYCPYINFLFATSLDGPWLPSIESYQLLPTFYMKVVISNIAKLSHTTVIPSEIITLNCLVCE